MRVLGLPVVLVFCLAMSERVCFADLSIDNNTGRDLLLEFQQVEPDAAWKVFTLPKDKRATLSADLGKAVNVRDVGTFDVWTVKPDSQPHALRWNEIRDRLELVDKDGNVVPAQPAK